MNFTYEVNENGEATITGYTGRPNKNVTIPSVVGEYPVTSIGESAFYDCTSLASITIPDSVTSIGYGAFYSCTSLKSITIPDSVTSIGDYVFFNCASLESITVAGNNQYYLSDEYGALFNKDKTVLIQYPIGNSRTSYIVPNGVTTISGWALYGCTSLESVTIPDSVTSIGRWAFYNTAYYNNESNWKNDVLYIGNHLINSKYTISGSYAVKDGTKTIAGSAFENCTNLEGVTIPNSVTSIGKYAFNNFTSLESVTIPNSVTSIGSYVFSYCTNLESITIPNSVTSIGSYAFAYCTSLTSITIGKNVTSIGVQAFSDCTSLESERRIYKAFNLKEGKLFCLDCEFFKNEWSEELDNIRLCQRGYHFCTNLFEIFNYYSGELDKEIAIYECEVGDKVVGSDTSKCVTNTIKPVKRLSRTEILKLLNV